MTGPTLATLRDLLLQLGFEDTSVEGKYRRFDHAQPNTWLLFRFYADDAVVSPGDVLSARVLLDYRGLMSPADFDQALRERALAS